ncbi:MarR family transcriptional regulator [Roseospira visakhapatnamensis]|uniref:DNA-binding MarR family transcriptional regulator n=1 Tax=Roseospira visakhapatnamensis TaxID=390880 RepID=A0A7W6RBW7_9PROT|nr:MarR family transcriptional regulator [Roseospira visakhapatnamensis]MBB4265568.1 DNA-binding MarR family transcriptional regulator [Roseospira visakhapatnamensis]
MDVPLKLSCDQALDLWRLAIVETVRRDIPDLSSRQMALLLTVYRTPPPHTVRGLAQSLNISKPAVTRALDRLGDYGLLRREVDEADRRSVLVRRTETGETFLADFGTLVRMATADALMMPCSEPEPMVSREVA